MCLKRGKYTNRPLPGHVTETFKLLQQLRCNLGTISVSWIFTLFHHHRARNAFQTLPSLPQIPSHSRPPNPHNPLLSTFCSPLPPEINPSTYSHPRIEVTQLTSYCLYTINQAEIGRRIYVAAITISESTNLPTKKSFQIGAFPGQ
jgi:hypothetical protein